MNVYITHHHLRRALGLGSAQTADDDLLLLLLGTASRLVETVTGRHFYPARQVRAYTWAGPTFLALDTDLLALAGLTNGDGAAIAPAACHLVPLNTPVKSGIALDPAQAVFVPGTDPVGALHVDGTWGFHPGWPEVWAASGDTVQDNPLAAGATTLTVSDADGLDPFGLWPRFAVGQLIQLEDEYLHVLGVDAVTNTLSVARGVNGTTPADHDQGTALEIYQPPEDVRQVCLRVAAWLYRQKDAGFVQAAGSLRGQVAVPPALPEDVQQALAPYVRVRVA